MLCKITFSGKIPDSITFCVLLGIKKIYSGLIKNSSIVSNLELFFFPFSRASGPGFIRKTYFPHLFWVSSSSMCSRRKEMDGVKCLSLYWCSPGSLTVNCYSFSGQHWQVSGCFFFYGSMCLNILKDSLRASPLQFLNMRD